MNFFSAKHIYFLLISTLCECLLVVYIFFNITSVIFIFLYGCVKKNQLRGPGARGARRRRVSRDYVWQQWSPGGNCRDDRGAGARHLRVSWFFFFLFTSSTRVLRVNKRTGKITLYILYTCVQRNKLCRYYNMYAPRRRRWPWSLARLLRLRVSLSCNTLCFITYTLYSLLVLVRIFYLILILCSDENEKKKKLLARHSLHFDILFILCIISNN